MVLYFTEHNTFCEMFHWECITNLGGARDLKFSLSSAVWAILFREIF